MQAVHVVHLLGTLSWCKEIEVGSGKLPVSATAAETPLIRGFKCAAFAQHVTERNIAAILRSRSDGLYFNVFGVMRQVKTSKRNWRSARASTLDRGNTFGARVLLNSQQQTPGRGGFQAKFCGAPLAD